MHAVARSITAVFTSKVPEEFGPSFNFRKVYYSNWDGNHITVEEFVPGTFHKYVNNDGFCVQSQDSNYNEIYEKAQCLSHFSYVYTDTKLMVLDLQGAKYELYDPEIATSKLFVDEDSSKDTPSQETFFCAGNLSTLSIKNFLDYHICNRFCKLMNLSE